MTTMGLTPCQAKVLAVIKQSFVERGIAPTIREIFAATGTVSFGGLESQLQALETRGYITRTKGAKRSIRLNAVPGFQFIPLEDLPRPAFSKGAIKADEQARLVNLLRTVPLPEVRRLTGRPFSTLAKIAEAVS